MAFVDTDHNGRIRNDELKTAIKWLLRRLADRSWVGKAEGAIPIAAIRADDAEGQALVESAKYLLSTLGVGDSATISLDQVRHFIANVKSRPLNGDGVLVLEACADLELKQFVIDIMGCGGRAQDSGGTDGIREEHLDRFMAAAANYLAWRNEAAIPEGHIETPVMCLGERTPKVFQVYHAHAHDVTAFFARCHLLRFRPEAAGQMAAIESSLKDVDLSSAAAIEGFLAKASIAQPNADGVLPLSGDAVNAAYAGWVAQLKELVLLPILGRAPESLTEGDWQQVTGRLAPYAAHVAGKKGGEVESLPVEKLLKYRDGDFAQRTRRLIAEDKRVSAILADAGQVEQMLLYCQNLLRLANNFVSFPEFYDPKKRALFELGSAVMDGRWFNLALRVDDIAAHSAMAKLSNIFTVYLEVTRIGTEDKFIVAVPVTAGTKGNLSMGKRGVFYDVTGAEHDARIIQLLEHPISLHEALAAPFVRVGRFVAGKIESFSGAGEKQLEGGIQGLMDTAKHTGAGQTAAGRAGLFVGVSIAVAALSSAFAFIVKTIAELGPYKVGLGVLGLLLVVMVPVAIVAIAKLRQRDLSALLEGCSWAVNARMRLSRAQGRFFTSFPRYPEGAEGVPLPRWIRTIIWLVVVAAILVGGIYGGTQVTSYLNRRKAQEQQVTAPAPSSPAAPTPAQPAQ